MITLILAQTQNTIDTSTVLTLGGVIGLLQVVQIILNISRRAAGRDAERQIEPTQIAAIQNKLDGLGAKAEATNREIGEIKTSVDALDKKVTASAAQQSVESLGVFKRLNAISTELTSTRTRVDILERQT